MRPINYGSTGSGTFIFEISIVRVCTRPKKLLYESTSYSFCILNTDTFLAKNFLDKVLCLSFTLSFVFWYVLRSKIPKIIVIYYKC